MFHNQKHYADNLPVDGGLFKERRRKCVSQLKKMLKYGRNYTFFKCSSDKSVITLRVTEEGNKVGWECLYVSWSPTTRQQSINDNLCLLVDWVAAIISDEQFVETIK